MIPRIAMPHVRLVNEPTDDLPAVLFADSALCDSDFPHLSFLGGNDAVASDPYFTPSASSAFCS